MSVVLTLSYRDSEPGGGVCQDDDDALREAAKVAREVLENYNSAESIDEKIRDFVTREHGEDDPRLQNDSVRLSEADLTDDDALALCAEDMDFAWSTLPGEPGKTPEAALRSIIFSAGLYTGANAADLLESGVVRAQGVVDCWERGDLAGAVNGLEGWIEDVKSALPGLDFTDDEEDEEGDEPGEAPPPPGYRVDQSTWAQTGSADLGVSWIAYAPDGERAPDDYGSRAYAEAACHAHARYAEWPLP